MARPPRRMPSLRAIMEHHQLGHVPFCVHCGRVGAASHCGRVAGHNADRCLVRAHIIDRVFGGLDNPANLAPLCHWCHDHQPIFRPGDEAEALAWFGLAPVDAADPPARVTGALAGALCDRPVPTSAETQAWWAGSFWPATGALPPHPVEIALNAVRTVDFPPTTTGWAYT